MVRSELKQCEGILFDELTHSYICGDKLLSGVTSLMAKHGLSVDYSGIPEAVLKRAAAKGSAIHSLLEDYDNGMPVAEDANVKAYRKLGLKVICSEYLVSDHETTASFIDKVLEDGSLADVKTTAEVHEDSVSWQLSIYAYLFERQNPGFMVPSLFCIHVRNGKARLIPIRRVPDAEVAELLAAEKEGRIYSRKDDAVSATEAITPDESAVLVGALAKIAAYTAAVKAEEAKVEKIKNRLYNYMTENNLNKVSCEGGEFVRKAESVQIRLDSKAIKEKEPEIFEKYSREIRVKGSITFKSRQ